MTNRNKVSKLELINTDHSPEGLVGISFLGYPMIMLLVMLAFFCLGCNSKSAGVGKIDSQKSTNITTNESDFEWPSWAGPRGDQSSNSVDWSTDWSGGLKELWRAELGNGYSGVVVGEGLLYSMGRNGKKDVVYCLDALSGQEKWRYEFDAKLFAEMHEGGPGSTPLIYEQSVFTFSRDGQFHCIDRKSGKLRWRRQLSEELKSKPSHWGFTSSPIIIDGKLVVDVGVVLALDPEDGQTTWSSKNKYKPAYCTPVVFQRDDKKMISIVNGEVIAVLDFDNGSEIARFPWKANLNPTAASPIVTDNSIFVTTGYREGCVLLGFDGKELKKVYQSKDLSSHMATPTLRGGYLFGIHGNSNMSRTCKLVCVDHQTGETVWFHRGFGCGTVILAGDRLLILSDAGELAVAKASVESYEQLSSAKVLDGICWTAPVVIGRRVYCRNGSGTLVCVELPDIK